MNFSKKNLLGKPSKIKNKKVWNFPYFSGVGGFEKSIFFYFLFLKASLKGKFEKYWKFHTFFKASLMQCLVPLTILNYILFILFYFTDGFSWLNVKSSNNFVQMSVNKSKLKFIRHFPALNVLSFYPQMSNAQGVT